MGSLDNIKSAAIEYATLKAQAKVIEERLEELKAIIGPVLAGKGKQAFSGASGTIYNVKVTESAGRKSLDKELMKADNIDPAKYEKAGKPFITVSTEIITVT